MRWPTLPPHLQNKKQYPRGVPHTHPSIGNFFEEVPEWPTPNEGCTTLTENFRHSVDQFGERPCMGERPIIEIRREERLIEGEMKMWNVTYFDETVWYTYNQIWDRAVRVGDGIKQLAGLDATDRVMIYEKTRLEWFLVAHGAWRHNFVVSTAYDNLGTDALLYSIDKIQAKVIFLNGANISKLLDNEASIPSLELLIYVDALPEGIVPENFAERFRIMSLAEVEQHGTENMIPEADVASPTRDDVCVIMFTSGSTGDPKGVVIRHRNLVAGTFAARGQLEVGPETVFISYLPLAHILEMEAENAVLFVGGSLGFGNPFTLVDRAASPMGDIQAFRPTIMLGVPRVWDTVKKAIWERVAGFDCCKAGLFRAGLEKKRASIYTNEDNWVWNSLVFNRFKERFGGRISLMASGAAPLSHDTHEMMTAIFDVPFTEGYGLTEVSGACLGQDKTEFGTETCGYPIIPAMIKLVDVPDLGYLTTDEPLERGEICVAGPIVSDGYYEMPELNAEVFQVDEDGTRWFLTGDIGQWNADGTMSIIDRKKNLIKLSGGEYVAVLKLESQYMSDCPFIAPNGCFVHADPMENCLVGMIAPQKSFVLSWADRHGVPRDLEQLIQNPDLIESIQSSMDRVAQNLRMERFEYVKKIALTLDNWELDPFLMTASRKLRRKNARERYADVLQGLYEEERRNPRRRVKAAPGVASSVTSSSTGADDQTDVVVVVEEEEMEEEGEDAV